MYIHRSFIAAFVAVVIAGALFIYFSKIKPRVVKRVLLIILVVLFATAGICDICFNLLSEKVYTSEVTISAKSTPLKTLRGNYYLVLNNEGYKCLCVDNSQAKTISANNCETTFDQNIVPQIVEKEVARTYHKEWFWFYGSSRGEDVVVYEFIIPSEDSILDVENLERASAGP